jgi:hypothetical protein
MAEDHRRPRSLLTGAVCSVFGPRELMIDSQHARIVIACDACGRLSEGESNEWVEAWLQTKRDGWPTPLSVREDPDLGDVQSAELSWGDLQKTSSVTAVTRSMLRW